MAMVPHERSLVEKNKNKPFALIGVNADEKIEDGKSVVKSKKINWRSFFDGRKASPIVRSYGIKGFPTLVLVDHKGIVKKIWGGRPKDEKEVEKAVADLVKLVPKPGKEDDMASSE